MKLTPFEAYKEYLALKNHFSKLDYDYFRYNGKLRLKVDSFEKRKDKLFFQKLAKHSDVHNFLLANFSFNEKLWIRDLAFSEEAEKTYKDWLKRQQSLSYIFKSDLDKLLIEFNDNFIVKNNEHPFLLKKFLSQEISLETICLLLEFSNALKHWDIKMQYDLVWDKTRTKIIKYMPFIKCDKEKLKNIVIDSFS